MDLEKQFGELNAKLDLLLTKNAALESQLLHGGAPEREPMKSFCQRHGISRVTAYAWNDRGLIKLEKVGGRQFVVASTLPAPQKFMRSPAAQA